jgi:hypothetical protein
MYYSEKIINGVMHWKTSADEEWQPYTLETLTARYAACLRKNSEIEAVIMAVHELSNI